MADRLAAARPRHSNDWPCPLRPGYRCCRGARWPLASRSASRSATAAPPSSMVWPARGAWSPTPGRRRAARLEHWSTPPTCPCWCCVPATSPFAERWPGRCGPTVSWWCASRALAGRRRPRRGPRGASASRARGGSGDRPGRRRRLARLPTPSWAGAWAARGGMTSLADAVHALVVLPTRTSTWLAQPGATRSGPTRCSTGRHWRRSSRPWSPAERPRAAGNAGRRPGDQRGDGQRRPRRVGRAPGAARAMRPRPRRRAGGAPHRARGRPAGATHRPVEPDRRRPAAGRVPGPRRRAPPRPRRTLRSPSAASAPAGLPSTRSRPPTWSSCCAGWSRARANVVVSGRTGVGQDDAAQRVGGRGAEPASASSRSRTPPSCDCPATTWCGWRPGPPTPKATAR